jgi:Tfp pilus assembly protein FimT
MIGLLIIGVVSAVAAPLFVTSTARNNVWTASETIGAQIRQARLKAISRNTTFQIRFNCPAAGQFRSLAMTGTSSIDNHVDRCSQTRDYDSGVFALPTGTSYGDADLVLSVNGRGVYSSANGSGIPETLSVTYGTSTRTLTVSATGQITFSAY